jgi:hypothetical protein
MKLAQIEHERCHEIAATTYVWVPDDFTADGLGVFVKAAQELYLKNEDDFKNAPGVSNPGYTPNYTLYPFMTVREVDAAHKEKLERYKTWIAQKNATRKTFSELLSEVSNGLIKTFYNLEPEIGRASCKERV